MRAASKQNWQNPEQKQCEFVKLNHSKSKAELPSCLLQTESASCTAPPISDPATERVFFSSVAVYSALDFGTQIGRILHLC